MNTSSKLLINESPLTVLPSLVKIVGLERAIILQQIQYLLQQKNVGIVLDGHKYIWNTAQEFKDNFFPFWEADSIRKHLRKLETDGFLITAKPLAAQRNHTKYYRIEYAKLDAAINPKKPAENVPEEVEITEDVNDLDAASYSESNRKIIRIEPEDNAASESEYDAGSLNETKTSTKTSGGGGGNGTSTSAPETGPPPTAADNSPPSKIPKLESRADYLLRKQLEYPHFSVAQVYADFKNKCGTKYPNMKDTQRSFDRWLETQDIEFEDEKQNNPVFDEADFFAKKYGGIKTNAA